jgi:cobyrinic acid a,c-diamide synthase
VLGAKGALVRGHEFHYASLVSKGDDDAFAELSDSAGSALGKSGGQRGRVTGTFFHAIAADTA